MAKRRQATQRRKRGPEPVGGLEITVFKCGHIQSVRTVAGGPHTVDVSRYPCRRCWTGSVRNWWAQASASP